MIGTHKLNHVESLKLETICVKALTSTPNRKLKVSANAVSAQQ